MVLVACVYPISDRAMLQAMLQVPFRSPHHAKTEVHPGRYARQSGDHSRRQRTPAGIHAGDVMTPVRRTGLHPSRRWFRWCQWSCPLFELNPI